YYGTAENEPPELLWNLVRHDMQTLGQIRDAAQRLNDALEQTHLRVREVPGWVRAFGERIRAPGVNRMALEDRTAATLQSLADVVIHMDATGVEAQEELVAAFRNYLAERGILVDEVPAAVSKRDEMQNLIAMLSRTLAAEQRIENEASAELETALAEANAN